MAEEVVVAKTKGLLAVAFARGIVVGAANVIKSRKRTAVAAWRRGEAARDGESCNKAIVQCLVGMSEVAISYAA